MVEPGSVDPEPEQIMLRMLRDTLYAGSWEDFESDLRARLEGRPYVFETVPLSPEVAQVIARHLELIREMKKDDE